MGTSKFMSNVYLLMTLGLFITGLVGYTIGNDPEYLSYIISETGFTMTGWVALLAPLALIFILPPLMERMGSLAGILLFMLFAILEGVSLSVIFLAYTEASIMLTFSVTAITFLIMSIIGYTTKTDLTKMGSLLTMALIGLIVAMVINMFLGSEMMDYIISAIGVLIFTGLIAYDTQKLKNLSSGINNEESLMRLSVMGALSLYLDFLNLFLFLLRFLGGSKD